MLLNKNNNYDEIHFRNKIEKFYPKKIRID